MDRLAQVDWTTLVVWLAIIVGVMAMPFELYGLIQRRWERQRRARIARGEDVTPRRVADDDEDE